MAAQENEDLQGRIASQTLSKTDVNRMVAERCVMYCRHRLAVYISVQSAPLDVTVFCCLLHLRSWLSRNI